MSVLEMATAKAFLARAKALALKKGARSVEIDRLVVELAKESLTSVCISCFVFLLSRWIDIFHVVRFGVIWCRRR